MEELETITLSDIEKVYALSEDVLKQIQMYPYYYNEEGTPYYMVSTENNTFVRTKYREYLVKEFNNEENMLLQRLIRKEEYMFVDILQMSAKDLLEQHLQPVIKKAIGIYRHGAIQDTILNDTNYRMSDDVTDEQIAILFALKVKDLMLLCAIQRKDKFLWEENEY